MTTTLNPASSAPLHLSPSEYHQHLLPRTVPKMHYGGGDVRAWQRRLRKKLADLVGPQPENRCRLRVRRLWKRDHPLGTIEKIVFTSEPACDVPAYVCLPKNVAPPYTFMICVQGHSTGMHNSINVQREDETLPHEAEGDRDFALGCMSHGIAALCIEQRSMGERREVKQKVVCDYGCHDAAMQALILGQTLIGQRVFDVDRGIDYLASRGDVDMYKIGVMGNSGGGTTTLFSAALLARVAYAMPSCYFCTFRDSIMAMFHCDCNYVPRLLEYAEMSDLMGLFAPKPVVIVAGKQDDLFPIGATRKAFKALRRIYRGLGAEKHCHLVEGEGGHRFYAKEAWPVMMKEIEKL